MVRTFLVGLCLLTVGRVQGVETDDVGKKDLAAMQGNWAAERYISNGTTLEDDDAQALFRTIKGNNYTVTRFRKVAGEGTFKLDATKSPKEIDMMPAVAKTATKQVVIRGIYKLEDGVLTICYPPAGKDRPTTFESKEGSFRVLSVWRKEQK